MKLGSFEGWYFKQNTLLGDYAIAFIVGRANDKNGNAHSFIQINHSEAPHSFYIKFPIEQFCLKKEPLEIRIGQNYFSLDKISVHIQTQEIQLSAKIAYQNRVEIKKNILSPNIMGVFSYLPFLECFHKIYSLCHNTTGEVVWNGKRFNFSSGNGYIEADYGTSFPKSWIWLQSNHFGEKEDNISVMCAIAKVPLLKASIKGLICVLLIGEKEYRFATYNFSKVVQLNLKKEFLEITLRKGKLLLHLSIQGEKGGELFAPANGAMENIIKEHIDASVRVTLTKNKKIIYSGTGRNAGYEINNFNEL